MKILYVDLQWDYGVKARGINQIGEIGFRQSMVRLGHQVSTFYYDDYLSDAKSLQAKLIEIADEISPDLIFFCLYRDQFSVDTLDFLKSKYRTINWFGDDQWRFSNFTSKYAPHFTYCITTDDFAVEKYKEIGIENVLLSQWAALDVDVPAAVDSDYLYDVSFIGGVAPTRKWIVSEFKKAGLNVHTFGHGWPSGPVSLEKMSDIFRRSKINLNLSNSINYDLRFLLNHPKNIPYAIKSAKNVSQVKARNFEIPYFGGFQLTEYLPSLENYFEIGREIACYSSIDEAIQLAQHYLKNNKVREEIKTKAIARARSEHTYQHRMAKVLSQL